MLSKSKSLFVPCYRSSKYKKSSYLSGTQPLPQSFASPNLRADLPVRRLTHSRHPTRDERLGTSRSQYHDAYSHGLRQLVEDKSVASCQQIGCKLIAKICYPQACCKLFQQVEASLQMTRCLILTDLAQLDKLDKSF